MASFFGYMLTAFGQVCILAVLIAIGFAADKTKLYTEKTARATNDLLFYIITPCVIIHSFLNVEFTVENGVGFLTAAVIAVVFHLLAIALSPLWHRKAGEDRAIFRYGTIFGNVGYMGLPLAQAVAGEKGVFYTSAVVAVFNVFAFTYGAHLMDKSGGKRNIKRMLINPGTIGITVGLPLFLLKVTLPDMLATPIEYIGSLNTPMAMIMFGTYLANTDLLDMFRRKENYITALIKLIALPLFSVTVLWLIGVRGDLLLTAAVFTAAPCANNTVMFAAKYGHNTGVASKLCGFTTVLAIFTMPISIALAQMLG